MGCGPLASRRQSEEYSEPDSATSMSTVESHDPLESTDEESLSEGDKVVVNRWIRNANRTTTSEAFRNILLCCGRKHRKAELHSQQKSNECSVCSGCSIADSDGEFDFIDIVAERFSKQI
ncbi:hypothetical protein ACOME3_006700 [Neoechinorhynchus agilis]